MLLALASNRDVERKVVFPDAGLVAKLTERAGPRRIVRDLALDEALKGAAEDPLLDGAHRHVVDGLPRAQRGKLGFAGQASWRTLASSSGTSRSEM